MKEHSIEGVYKRVGGVNWDEARTGGAKHPMIEGEARIESEACSRLRGRSFEFCPVSLSSQMFSKFILETVQSRV